MNIHHLAVFAALLLGTQTQTVLAQPTSAALQVAHSPATLKIELSADALNPARPKMGDNLVYRSVIQNTGTSPVRGLVAWLGLVQVDPGLEQPVDLEDWSAHKAITAPMLAPGESVMTTWPMRLIAAGNYRVVISAAGSSGALQPSNFVDLVVAQKPVVESGRVLPVAIGVPLLLGGALFLRRRA